MDDDSADSESTQIVGETANPADISPRTPEPTPSETPSAQGPQPNPAPQEAPQATAPAEAVAQPQVPQPQVPQPRDQPPLEAPLATTAPAGWDAQAAGPAPLEAPLNPAAPAAPVGWGAQPAGPAPYYAAPPFGVEPVEPVPAKSRNVLALLGLILAVPVWPAGLILSALGLFTAVSRRTGKVMAIIGLVLSVVTGGAIIAGLAAATSAVAASTALDPGCTSVDSSLATDLASLKTDATALESEKDSASTSSNSIGIVNTDLSAIEGDLATASGKATHATVKSDLDSMNTQVQVVGKALTAIVAHSTSSDGAASAALTTLQGKDADLDALCAAY